MLFILVQIQAGPPAFAAAQLRLASRLPAKAARRSLGEGGRSTAGAIAQLGERLLCKQEVVGSIPSGSTIFPGAGFLLERTADAHVGVRIGGSCLIFFRSNFVL